MNSLFRLGFILLSLLCLVSLPAENAYAQTPTQTETSTESESSDQAVFVDDTVESAFRTVKRNENYQFDLAEPIPQDPPSPFSIWLGGVLGAIFGFLIPIFQIAFWLGLGALVIGALYLIGRAIYETRFAKEPAKKAPEPEIPLYQPASAQARVLLEEVDRLAANGQYGEAVHTLLFRSIQDIDRNRPNVVRRSLTAREIGTLSVLTIEARTAFSTIAGVSELAHFGGVAVNKAGFETARAAYTDLTGLAPAAPKRSRR